MTARICLNMIVKNEARIILRCLESLSPHIDCYVICDTGSTDGTREIIADFFATRGVPGLVTEAAFVNFEQARNAALEQARASPLSFDYLLFCDADMEFKVARPAYRMELSAPAYLVLQRMAGGLQYHNLRLLRRDVAARYRGVTHEHLDLGGARQEVFDGIYYVDHAEGANRVEKFARDIRLLKAGLAEDPHNARYMFYLAQSHRDAGELQDAHEVYARRVAMGGWAEEVWYAMLQMGLLAERLRWRFEEVFRQFLAAYEHRPARAETLVELARFCRVNGRHALALPFAARATTLPLSTDTLFVNRADYEWRGADELSLALYWTGDYDGSARVCRKLLESPVLPPDQRARLEQNLDFALAKLRGAAAT